MRDGRRTDVDRFMTEWPIYGPNPRHWTFEEAERAALGVRRGPQRRHDHRDSANRIHQAACIPRLADPRGTWRATASVLAMLVAGLGKASRRPGTGITVQRPACVSP